MELVMTAVPICSYCCDKETWRGKALFATAWQKELFANYREQCEELPIEGWSRPCTLIEGSQGRSSGQACGGRN